MSKSLEHQPSGVQFPTASLIAKELGFTLEAHPGWARVITDAVKLARAGAFREAKAVVLERGGVGGIAEALEVLARKEEGE